ncbi:hypothetical protein GCM10027162_19440 [Streptomyces incanus]
MKRRAGSGSRGSGLPDPARLYPAGFPRRLRTLGRVGQITESVVALVPSSEFEQGFERESVIVHVRVHIAEFGEARGHGREIEVPRVRDGHPSRRSGAGTGACGRGRTEQAEAMVRSRAVRLRSTEIRSPRSSFHHFMVTCSGIRRSRSRPAGREGGTADPGEGPARFDGHEHMRAPDAGCPGPAARSAELIEYVAHPLERSREVGGGATWAFRQRGWGFPCSKSSGECVPGVTGRAGMCRTGPRGLSSGSRRAHGRMRTLTAPSRLRWNMS